MSYTLITVFAHPSQHHDTLPVKDLKVGDEVYAYVDRQEGDDCDYHGFRMLTIKALITCGTMRELICLEFEGICPCDDIIVKNSSHIEISGTVTIREQYQ